MSEKIAKGNRSGFARKRSIARGAKSIEPNMKRKKISGGGSTAAPTVFAHKRVGEFLGERLTVSATKLVCKTCHREVSDTKRILLKHVASCRYMQGRPV